jgi:putative membrane protein
MMKRLRSHSTPLLLAPLLLASGCDRESPANAVDGSGLAVKGGHEGVRPEGVSSTDDPVTTTLYIDQAAYGDLYEIEAAGVALKRSKDPAVRAFAEMMLDHHGKTLDALKQFVADNPVNRAVPDILDPRRRAMIDNLTDAADAEFDHDYLGQQQAAHDEAYNLHKSFVNGKDYPKLGELAAKAAQVVEQHRQQLKSLQAKAGANNS